VANDLPLNSLVYPVAIDRGRRQPLVRRASRAWDLTPAAQSAFHFLTLFPNRSPDQAGTHDDAPIIEWLSSFSTAQIHAPSCPL